MSIMHSLKAKLLYFKKNSQINLQSRFRVIGYFIIVNKLQEIEFSIRKLIYFIKTVSFSNPVTVGEDKKLSRCREYELNSCKT